MNFLEEKILADGSVKPGNILKVDNFLNHQIDVDIIRRIATELKRRFEGETVTRILTIEASGIAIATFMGFLYNVPIVFAKKGKTANSTDDKYMSQAYSFTHKKMNDVYVSRPYMPAGEKVLIVDDFLADGQAMSAPGWFRGRGTWCSHRERQSAWRKNAARKGLSCRVNRQNRGDGP